LLAPDLGTLPASGPAAASNAVWYRAGVPHGSASAHQAALSEQRTSPATPWTLWCALLWGSGGCTGCVFPANGGAPMRSAMSLFGAAELTEVGSVSSSTWGR